MVAIKGSQGNYCDSNFDEEDRVVDYQSHDKSGSRDYVNENYPTVIIH
ncbi:MAG TPA: hypothetical protein QF468_09740 [Nitrospinota bacterium]|nr:hypothetical protein [Nitrospinota bacterium]